MKRLVEDRRQLASIQRPRSTGPVSGKGGNGKPMTVKEFAAKMKGGTE
jgi:hypothetical protein